MAHIRMLESIGLLGSDELPVLLDALKDIAAMIERGEFEIGEGIEDVHSQVEFLLTERLRRSRQEDPFKDARATIRCSSTSNFSCVMSLPRQPMP